MGETGHLYNVQFHKVSLVIDIIYGYQSFRLYNLQT